MITAKRIFAIVMAILLISSLPVSVCAQRLKECYSCDQTGNCTLCRGSKVVPCDQCGESGIELCDVCHGSGKIGDNACGKCGGVGTCPCRLCSGTAIMTCNRCKGSGKCLECYGTGFRGEIGVPSYPKDGDIVEMRGGRLIEWGTGKEVTDEHPSATHTDDTEHTEHKYGDWVSYDDTMHTHTCTCGDAQFEEHTWDDGTVTAEATHKTDGSVTYTCTACGESKTDSIPAIDHVFSDWEMINGELVRSCECGEKQTKQVVTAVEIKDEETGVSVSAKESDAIPEGTKLVGEEITDKLTSEEKQTVEAAVKVIGDGDEVLSVFDISLEFESAKIQPDGTVKVELPMPKLEAGKEFKTYKVVYIDDEGAAHDMPTEVKDGKIIFTTDHLSRYAIVGVNASDSSDSSDAPQTESWILPVIICAAAVAIASAASLIAVKKKKA